jgi:hypothetical protein
MDKLVVPEPFFSPAKTAPRFSSPDRTCNRDWKILRKKR